MELKKDLLKKDKKSVFRIILGILFVAISIIWIADKITSDSIIRSFDWLYSGIFMLGGVIHTFEGFGFSLAKLFGKAFVLIDSNQISIKLGLSDKEQQIYWKDIKAIGYKFNKFQIRKHDNTNINLNLSKVDYALKNEIKEVVYTIAKNKNIPLKNE